MLDKARLSVAKIILGCLKTTSSSNVLADLNLTGVYAEKYLCFVMYIYAEKYLCFVMYPN